MKSSQPPIQNIDAFDVVGERQDGGVDLVVSCSGPLDSSPSTLELIEIFSFRASISYQMKREVSLTSLPTGLPGRAWPCYL